MARTSFASERTLEYVLIPKIKDLLSHKYRVVPIYPWKQYEGNNLGKSSFDLRPIKVLAFFPRRPKVNHPFSNDIELKINNVLGITSTELDKHKIPCIAGAPLISNLDGLEENAPIVLFNIKGQEFRDTYYVIDKNNSKVINKEGDDSIHLINKNSLLDIVDAAPNIIWEKALEIIDTTKKKNNSISYNQFYGPRYKPIYFVLISSKDRNLKYTI